MQRNAIERSIWIDAPRARVWQAVTDPEQLAQWLLPPMLGAQMKSDANGNVFVCMGGMEVPFALLEDADPGRRVAMRGLPDKLGAVTYTLEDENNGTRVTVAMSGLESLAADAYQERVGPSTAAWEKALENLKAYVGEAELPFPQGYVAALLGYRREAEAKYAVERSIWINAPRERVWRAITDPKQVQQWFSPNTEWRLSALEVGGRLYVYDPETDTDKYIQVIEVLDPPQHLVTRTIPESSDMQYGVTSYWLEEEKGGTRLTLTQSGYDRDDADTRHQNMEQNAFGFGMMLENLRASIEGAALPYPFGF